MCFGGICDVKGGFVKAVASRWAAGGGRGGGTHGLWIQMNHHPAQIIVTKLFILPDDGSNGLLAATHAGHDALPNVCIKTVGSVLGIVQASNRQPHGDCQTNSVVANRFLQNDEAA